MNGAFSDVRPLFLSLLLIAGPGLGAQTLAPASWAPLWTRDAGAGSAVVKTTPDGTQVLEVTHRGGRDWAVSSGHQRPVRPGDQYTLAAQAGCEGAGSVGLEVVARDSAGATVSWSYGRVDLVPGAWRAVNSSFTVALGVATIEARWSGSGPSTSTLGAIELTKTGEGPNVAPSPVTLNSTTLSLSFDPANGAFSVLDRRTGFWWTQRVTQPHAAVTLESDAASLKATLVDPGTGRALTLALTLDPALPEAGLSLDGEGALPGEILYPFAWQPAPGDRLILPVNEGISYPVDDAQVPEGRFVGYGGHGLCMSFWGLDSSKPGAASGPGVLTLLETPDDAAVDIRRADGTLTAAPVWEAQKGRFGYQRNLRFVFFDHGGVAAFAHRYRQYAEARGTVVTLAQKRQKNPNVDKLAGAADVWYWGSDAPALAAELRSAGMDKVLWSNGEPAAAVQAINGLGYLTGRYDLYQDIMDPAQYPRLPWIQEEWTPSAWPDDVVLDRSGNPVHGWEVVAKDGTRVPAGVLNDEKALPVAEARITKELAAKPYTARFIDTTTASAWREDWSPAHPLTRTQSREWRMRLLDLVSNGHGLVTGSETGHDAAVPFVHYFEGMMSLAPFRIPDAGRNMQTILDQAPPVIEKFQLGWKYRLPLWELVYHDSVVAYWYWGDYSNKIPSVWALRDQFNALYGTPPVYMFTSAFWKANRQRFAQSYRTATATAKATMYARMDDFQVLTPDRSVQRTVFSNGVTVTANFGSSPWTDEHGVTVAPGQCVLKGG
jgi:hypothetical protein